MNQPKILLLDIETAPIEAHVWSIWNQDIGLNQIMKDWAVIAWCAKWLGDKKLYYQDQRNSKNIRNDKKLLKPIWNLLNEADIVITQNGKRFDEPKLRARFIINGFKPYSGFQHVDTKVIAKKFGFTSYRLEYLLQALNCKVQKSKHQKFPGHELWTECLKGNKEAWKEMEHYNKLDVLGLEELYKKLQPWDEGVNFSVYSAETISACNCGSTKVTKTGFKYTRVGKFQRFQCQDCGHITRSTRNMLPREKKESLRV